MSRLVITESALDAVAKKFELDKNALEVKTPSGGYSRNRLAIIKSNHRQIFVKEVDTTIVPGSGQEELGWLKKDYLCMKAIQAKYPEIVPDWIELIHDDKVLCMPAYSSESGWQWHLPNQPEEQAKYIELVVNAIDSLEKLKFDKSEIAKLNLAPVFKDDLASNKGIELMASDENYRKRLISKYQKLLVSAQPHLQEPIKQIITLLGDAKKIQELVKEGQKLAAQPNDYFGHCDIRTDNIAYNPKLAQIKLVDWNWASYTPKNFGATEFLVNAKLGGADIEPWTDKLNREMIASFIGLFTRSCLKDELVEGGSLRDYQANTAAIATYLHNKLSS
ncbi:hypothetical protein CR969_01045 [Candidatus Saccharibacteria bacterium]|nr:MAG: hypothetical protein CR969_01045 [Candidatus Saccharibacteria bacterium]